MLSYKKYIGVLANEMVLVGVDNFSCISYIVCCIT